MHIPTKYDLRWVVTYLQRQPVIGVWNRANTDKRERLSALMRSGMLEVVIQGKNKNTMMIDTLLKVPAYTFKEVRWQNAASVPLQNLKTMQKCPGQTIGVFVHTEDFIYHVSVSGKVSKTPVRKVGS